MQRPQPTSFDCSIDGSVLSSVTGEPIVRAHVTLQGPGTASTVTDASGRWSLSNVGCATTQVMASRVAFLSSGRDVTLVSGSPMHDVTVKLLPQSVLLGKVVDDQGDPVMGVQIVLVRLRVLNGNAVFQHAGLSGNTNDLGEYRIPGLVAGKFIVCASLPNSPPRSDNMIFAETCYPGPPDSGAASALELAPGQEAKVDFALNPVPAVHVRGTVTGLPEGRGVGITLNPRRETGGLSANSPIRERRFDFRVGPGSYMLAADYFEAGKHLTARVPAEVGSLDIDNLAVTMDTPFVMTGSVRIQDQSRQPEKTMQFGISLQPSERTSGAGPIKWDPNGSSFSFSDVLPGTYRLQTFPPAPFYVKSATLAGQDILTSEFTVSQSAGPIEIVVADDGGSIEGDLVNANGEAVHGGILAMRDGKTSMAGSDQGGHFKLQNLAPGDYRIYAWDDPSQVPYADTEWMRRYAGSGSDVTVSSGQSSQVKLTLQNVPQ